MLKIDWDLIFKIVIPIITLILGKYYDKLFKTQSKLITYYGHVSAFKVTGQNNIDVFTHSIVISNVGTETANKVRIGHNTLPINFVLHPSVPYTQVPTASGGAEIVIDTLVPKDQVTISYLYFPPLTYGAINSYIKSDEGFARVINVIPSPEPNKRVLLLTRFLMYVGGVSLIYLTINFIFKFI